MSKAKVVAKALEEATMFTNELKSLIAMQKELGMRYRDLDTMIGKMIDLLQSPVDDDNKKQVFRVAEALRNQIHNLKTVAGNINLDFILKL